jgi:hypothetical protein
MRRFNCAGCSAPIEVPPNYQQPFIKCGQCGSHEKIPLSNNTEPKFKILTDQQRARRELAPETKPAVSDFPSEEETTAPVKPAKSGPKVVAPVIARKKTAAGWKSSPVDYKKTRKPIGTQAILRDALGEEGLEMVFELVASYLSEADESRRRTKKSLVIQRIIKSGLPGEVAGRAVVFAENSPETQKILISNYRSNLYIGLGIFAAGLVISLMVHLLANPGRGFILFQVPFAVGFAYAANAAVNLLGLKYPVCKTELVHYVVMTFMALLILGYVIWGFYY